jgi:GTP cyclohydrolase IA
VSAEPGRLAAVAVAGTADAPDEDEGPARGGSPAVARAVADLLDALGLDRDGDGLRDTPWRVARMLDEFLSPPSFRPTTFPSDGYEGLVAVRDIAFSSLCEHHLLPFFGVAHVGYVPDDRIIGLSKLPRAVEERARRLQVQERLTVEIADWLERELAPRGVGVVLEATHLCMTIRGVRQPTAMTRTSSLRGIVRSDPAARQEFLELVGARSAHLDGGGRP